jgi:hypothetical protein
VFSGQFVLQNVEVHTYPAKSLSAALTRRILRLVVLLGLGATALLWSTDETGGQRVVLWLLTGALLVLAMWGAVETWREAKPFRTRGDA